MRPKAATFPDMARSSTDRAQMQSTPSLCILENVSP